MTAVIKNLFDSSRAAADEMEREQFGSFRDVEDWIDYELSLLGAIRRVDARYDQRVRSREVALDRGLLESIHRLYEAWYAAAARLLREVERLEAQGVQVDNAPALKEACRGSHVPGLEPERIDAALRQFERGEGLPLGEVVNALRGGTVE